MVIECYYRKYPTNGQELWAREQLAKTINDLNNGTHPHVAMFSVP
jgi:hypothetical protein